MKDIPSGQKKLGYIDNIDWKQVYLSIYKSSISVTTREFQFKLLHNYLPVNHNLLTWKLIDSNRCSLCFIEAETLEHLFCFCPTAITLFCEIKEWLSAQSIMFPSPSAAVILFGVFTFVIQIV